MEHDPVCRGRAAYEDVFMRFNVEENTVADDLAVVVARHELFCLVDVESGKTIDGQMRQQPGRIRTLDE